MSKTFKCLSSSINKIRFFLAICTIGLLTISAESSSAQTIKDLHGEVELQTIGTTNGVVPFWMRSNQFGSIPLSGFSQSFIGRINKDYEKQPDSSSKKRKLIDWGFGIEARGNVGNKMNGQLIEVYGKVKLSIFQLKIGRTKDVVGLNGDTLLSSGNFTLSGNALGIPKIEISIPSYSNLGFLGESLALKGSFSHGWVGKITAYDNDIIGHTVGTYLHQKSLYGRIGRANSKMKLYGGFNHQVFWGNEKMVFPSYDLTSLQTFFYVVTGKAYGAKDIPTSKIGNQIGSIDIGMSYRFREIDIMLYRQNFYDVGALAKLANIRDGLNGISFKNLQANKDNKNFVWKRILFEFLYTYNQAGEKWSKVTKSGDEDYYNNYYYPQGWSYKGNGLGTPLITAEKDAKPGQPNVPGDYFVNNRVIAFHTALEGSFRQWNFTSKLTYSYNYGTFGTSPIGKTTGKTRVSKDVGLFTKQKEFSGYLAIDKHLSNGLTLGAILAIDRGGLLYNSNGISFKALKAF